MPNDRGVLRTISWRDLCPWLILFRVFRPSISISVLTLSTIAVLLTPLGWQAGEWLMPGSHASWTSARHTSLASSVPVDRFDEFAARRVHWPPSFTQLEDSNLVAIYCEFVRPYGVFVREPIGWRDAGRLVIGMVWTLVVWGYCGGAITRLIVVALGREERIGLSRATLYAGSKLASYVAAPLFPVLGVVLLGAPIAFFGWIVSLGEWGVMTTGLLWVPILIGGLLIVVLVAGLLFGWPLMWVAISTERTGDAFEGLNRSFAYTFQRPLHYALYAAIAAAFGTLCWTAVSYGAEAIIGVCWRAASWGGGEAVSSVRNAVELGGTDGITGIGCTGIAFGVGLVKTVAVAFNYGFFWCSATVIYLLLRQHVDQTEFDEVYMPDELDDRPLPDLANDENGVPDLPE